MKFRRLHSWGGWLSLLAIVGQLLVPVSHLAMNRASLSTGLFSAFCRDRTSAIPPTLERSLPVELRGALARSAHQSSSVCGDCLSPGACALPLTDPPAASGFNNALLQTFDPLPATGLRASLSIPPATGPPVRT